MSTAFPVSSLVKRLIVAVFGLATLFALAAPLAQQAEAAPFFPARAFLDAQPNPQVPALSPFAGPQVTLDASRSRANLGASISNYSFDLNNNGIYETNNGTDATRSVRYTTIGQRTVGVRITTTSGARATRTVVVKISRAPIARLSVTPTTALIGESIALNAAASTDDIAIAKYQWDLDGDGNFETDSGTDPRVTKSFGSIGQRALRVRVTDNYGATNDATVAVNVHRAPTAAFSATPQPGFVNEAITFDASASSDDGTIASYEWDLDGNGSFETTTTTPTTSKAFPAPTTVTVRLRTVDNNGATDIASRSVTVVERPPVDNMAPRMIITPGSVKMTRAGYVTLKVLCLAPESRCKGSLQLKRRGKAIGTKAFNALGGRTVNVTVKLTPAAKAAVKRVRTISASARASARDDAGNQGASSRGITIRR